MTKNKLKKKILSFIMALAMVLTLLPVQSMTAKADWYSYDSNSTGTISVGSQKIPVAVYATDGSQSFNTNTDLMDILGLGYVQDDCYAPIGVIYLDSSFFRGKGKRGPYIQTQADWQTVRDAISDIDTGALNPSANAYKNRGNKVASMLDYVSPDVGYSAGSLRTALFNWDNNEQENSILKDGAIAEGRNQFEYHLDLRFKTSTLTIKNAKNDMELGSRVYLTGTNTIDPANSKDWYITVPEGSAITGYYTDKKCQKAYTFGTPLNYDTTIYVKIEEKQFNVTYDLNGGSIGSSTADVVNSNVSYGSVAPSITEPTKTDCVFTGWLASDTGIVYTTSQLATRYITGDVTFTAQWKVQDKDYTVVTKLQNPDGFYTTTSETRPAAAGENVTITPETKEGYKLDETASKLSGTNDGSLVLTLVYKSTNIPYTVNYYQQNASGNGYTCVGFETKNGAEGDEVSITPASDKYTGFKLSDKSVTTGTITAGSDGQLSLNVYYDRQTYTVTYEYTGTVPEDAASLRPESQTVRYGANVDIAGNVMVDGYTFTGWSTSSDIIRNASSFTMPAADVTFTGSFNAKGDTEYTVERYIEKLGADNKGQYDKYDSTVCTGTTGFTISVNPENITGFTFDETKSAGYDSQTIKGNGKTVVKLYYSRNEYQVTISYPAKPGQEATTKTKTYQYGETLKKKDKPSADGYDFNTSDNWPNKDTTVTGDMNITGNWEAKDVNYTVEYYGENANDDGYSVIDSQNLTAKTDTQVSLTAIPQTKGNYTYDSQNTNNVTSATVAGNGSTVLKVYYKRNTYTVTYNVTGTNGNTSDDTTTYKWGQSFTLADKPETIEGYTFQGWNIPEGLTGSDDSYTMPTKDIEITGYYQANKGTAYKIEYYTEDLDTNADGSAKYSKVVEMTKNLTGTTDTTVTTDNYEEAITGFTLDKNIAGTVASDKIAGNGTTTLKLYYSRNSYTVSYLVSGTDEEIESSTVKYGAALDEAQLNTPDVPEGYTFSGYTYNNGDLPETMPAENITLTGSITPNTDTNVTVKYYFETLDGDYKEDAAKASEKNIKATTDTTVFPADNQLDAEPTGFYYDADKSGNEGTNVDGDGKAVLNVYYTRHEYTVSYSYSNIVKNASDLPDTESYKYGATVKVAKAATAPGYNFTWNKAASFAMPAEDVTITGTFTASGNSSYTTEYYFEGLDGEYAIDDSKTTKTENVRAGETANAVETEFTGFTLNKAAEGTIASGTIEGNDSLVLKLYYSRNTYKLTIKDENGNVIGTKDVKYGEKIPTGEAPEKAGYNFNKWVDENGGDLPDTMEGNITIKPSYTAGTSSYKVEYYKQNLEDDDYTLADTVEKSATTDTDITAEEAPAGKDYTHYTKVTTADSLESGKATGDGQTVLKVYYNRNTYKVTYNYSGIIPTGFNAASSSQEYRYGSQVTIASYPSVDGYTFQGWGYDELAIESIDRDYTFTGSFVANGDTEYKVHYYIEDLVYDENGNYVGGKYTEYKTITYTGQTDTTANAAEITIPGFTLDTNNSANVATGNIEGDGSRELSLYYSRNLHTVTIHYNTVGGQKLVEDVVLKVPYGGLFTVNTPAVDGYTPDYKSVSNPEGGMTDQDITIAVTYTANPVATVETGSTDGGSAVAVSTNEIVQPTATAATVPYTTTAVTLATGNTVVTVNPEATVDDTEVPEARLSETEDGDTELVAIESDETPLATEEAAANPWALINLLSMLLTAIIAIYLIIKAFKKKDQENEEEAEDTEEKENYRRSLCIGGLLPAVVAIIVFFLTENMKNPMAFIDKWTILMIILLAIEALLAYLARTKKEDDKEQA